MFMNENSKMLCVIIPIYKQFLNEKEILSVNSYVEYFKNIDIFFVCPQSLDINDYKTKYESINYVRFDDCFFQSNKSYNNLMLSEKFYEEFHNYVYMLIAQTDAIIFNQDINITEFINSDYDYIGAPWYYSPFSTKDGIIKYLIKKLIIHDSLKMSCGNGGFSLRKISSMIELLRMTSIYRKILWHYNEDIFFSYVGRKRGYKIAPCDIAEKFALEQNMKERISLCKFPLALHAWEKEFTSYKELENFRDLAIQNKKDN